MATNLEVIDLMTAFPRVEAQDRPSENVMTGSEAAESEWHNFLGGESSPGEHSPAPSVSHGFSAHSVNTPAGLDEACSRPQDEQRERRPMHGQAGRASTRSSMSDGSSTMRQSGCFRHRVRFSDEGRNPQTLEDGDEVGDEFSAELSLTTSLFMGSASRGVVIPRLDTSKVVPTIMLGNIAASRPIKPLVTSYSNPSPRSTPPPSSARSQQQPRTTPRSNSASSFGATNSSTAASTRQAAITPRPVSTPPPAAVPKSARSSAVKPTHTASPAASANGSISARRSSSGTRVASNFATASVAPAVSSAAAAPTPAAPTSSRGFNSTGSTSSSNRLTPRGSTTSLGKPLAKSSSASPLTVPTTPPRALSPSPQPMSKQSLPPVPFSRQTSGKRSSTVAGGGALVSAPSKLPWSNTIGVRPPSQASSNISQLSGSPSFDRKNRLPTVAHEFMFTTSGQPSSGPTTPAKVGSVANRAQAAAAAAVSQSSPATPVSRLHQAQPHDNASSQPAEDGDVEQLTPRGALAPQNASDDHMGASQCINADSVALDVLRGENSDVWSSDNRSEEQAHRSPQKAAHNKLSAVLSSPMKAAASTIPQQRSTPTNSSSSTAQASRTVTARSTAVIAGTAAAWSPEKVKPSGAAPARFVPASLQLHDEDLAQRVAAAAVSKAQLLDLVKMAVESVEGARTKAAAEESAAAAAAAEAKNKGAVRGGIEKGGMVMVGDGSMGNDGEIPVKSRCFGCSIM